MRKDDAGNSNNPKTVFIISIFSDPMSDKRQLQQPWRMTIDGVMLTTLKKEYKNIQ